MSKHEGIEDAVCQQCMESGREENLKPSLRTSGKGAAEAYLLSRSAAEERSVCKTGTSPHK